MVRDFHECYSSELFNARFKNSTPAAEGQVLLNDDRTFLMILSQKPLPNILSLVIFDKPFKEYDPFPSPPCDHQPSGGFFIGVNHG